MLYAYKNKYIVFIFNGNLLRGYKLLYITRGRHGEKQKVEKHWNGQRPIAAARNDRDDGDLNVWRGRFIARNKPCV